MVRVVYIDVLFAVNLILNYFILLTVSRVLHRQDKRLRLLIGAGVGAVYALFIFLPEMGFLSMAGMKFLLSVGVVLAAFKITTPKALMQLIGMFYFISFLFGGLIFALYFFCTPPGMLMKNGIVYFDISPVLLVFAAGGCYIVITLLSRLLHRKEPDFYTLSITVDGKTVSVPALLDTGNALHDPLSDLPVLIAEYAAMHVLFPKELRSFFKKGVKDALPQLHGTGWESRFRMIPYGGLNGKGGLLPAFRPDNVAIPCEGRIIKTGDVFVAVCSGRLCSDGRYRALLTPELFRKVLGDDSFDNTPSVPKDHAFLHGSIK